MTLDENGNLTVHQADQVPATFPLTEPASPTFVKNWVYRDSDTSVHFSLDKKRTIFRYERFDVGPDTNAILKVNNVTELVVFP